MLHAILLNTLRQTYKLTHYIFMLVRNQKSVVHNFKFYQSTKALPKPYKSFYFQMKCTVEIRVKVLWVFFRKNNTFDYNIIYSTEILPIYIFVCLKILLTSTTLDQLDS